MRLPNPEIILNTLDASFDSDWTVSGVHTIGRITQVQDTILHARLPHVPLGQLCLVDGRLYAEVVGIKKDAIILSPFAKPFGIHSGSTVQPLHEPHCIETGHYLLGTVVDGFGELLTGTQTKGEKTERRNVHGAAPHPLTRTLIDRPLLLGVRAIDAFLTMGLGQRVGIFSSAGVGKSTLLSMITQGTQADIIVLALVGERGREVREFLEHTLDEQTRKRVVTVVATADRSPLERTRAPEVATTIAEYFRDQGHQVLLLMDSVTRFARAQRDLALAAGEPLSPNGFPPRVFSALPQLLERAGPAAKGSITAIYTVLAEQENARDPLAEEVRSILDGHIILSRKLAEESHYPAIDILRSISRVMPQITHETHQKAVMALRKLMARYLEIELLLRVGEYEHGMDSQADEAIDKRDAINAFLCQRTLEKTNLDDLVTQLENILDP